MGVNFSTTRREQVVTDAVLKISSEFYFRKAVEFQSGGKSIFTREVFSESKLILKIEVPAVEQTVARMPQFPRVCSSSEIW